MLTKGDFIRLEYTAYNKNGEIFDSTNGAISKKLRGKEGPILVVYGFGHTIIGLEEKIKDLEIGKEIEVEIPPEKSFGKRKKDLLKVMKEEEFIKYQVMPKPGTTIHVDFENSRLYGTIKSATSGRVLVDFNHPLSGQTLKYRLKIIEKLEKPEEKVRALIQESELKCDFFIKGGIAEITAQKPEKMDENQFESEKLRISFAIKTFVPQINEVKFK